MIVLYVLIAKGLISAGSTYAEDVSTPVKSEVMTEPVPVADAVAVEVFEAAAPGKTDEQLMEELATLVRTYLILDVIVYGGGDVYREPMERVRLAILSYGRHMFPAMLEVDIYQTLQQKMFPELMDELLENRLFLNDYFAQSLIIGVFLKNINPNDAYTEFSLPNYDAIERMTQTLRKKGFKRSELIEVMESYRDRYLASN